MQSKIDILKSSLRDLEAKQDHLLGKIENKIQRNEERHSTRRSLKSIENKSIDQIQIEWN